MNRRLVWVAVAGLLAYGALFFRVGRTPGYLSRADIPQMRDLALESTKNLLGVDLSSWESQPKDMYNHPLRLWQMRYARDPFDYLISPLQTRFGFEAPSSDINIVIGGPAPRDISVMVGTNGRLVSIRQDAPSSKKKKNKQPMIVSDRQQTAEKALKMLTGDFSTRFQPSKTKSDGEISEYRWTAEAPGKNLTWEVAVSFDGNAFREAVLTQHMEPNLAKQLESKSQAFGEASRVAVGVTIFFGSFFLFISYLLRWLRGHIDHRSALTAGIIMLVSGAISIVLSMGLSRGPGLMAPTGALVGTVIWLTIAAVAIIGVGHDCARRHEWPRWRELRLLLQRKWLARDIGRSAMQGFAWSGLLALIPLAILQSGVFADTQLQWTRYFYQLMSPAPALQVLFPIFDTAGLCFLGGMLPMVTNAFPSRKIGLALFVVLCSAAMLLFPPFGSGLVGASINAVLTTVLLLWIYNTYGLMAALFAAKGEAGLSVSAMLITSANANVQVSGWITLLSLVGLVAVAAVLSARGSMVEPDATDTSRRYLSQKERLKAEFSLAQQAQQRMLPAQAPFVEGFSIAGSCQPARDVGGDLYDYFQFVDGRLGICVADVSGKGMPAALYMTLTKGAIAAAAPDSGDVSTLAKHLNRHLHIACKRKMFVTAIIGALDTQTRNWEFIRAGHNALLYYEAAIGSARYLSPAGLGLGLTGPAMFDRGIRLERVALAPGDVLVLYSDGLTEAMNEQQELFGEDRLKATVERAVNGSAAALLDEIKRDVASFTGTEPAHDDMTIVVLQANSEAS